MEPVPNEEIGQFVELAIRLPFITRTTGEWQTPPKSEGKHRSELIYPVNPGLYTLVINGLLLNFGTSQMGGWTYQTACIEESRK